MSSRVDRAMVEGRVRATIAAELRVEAEAVTETAHLMTDLGADSLDALNIALQFERVFAIKIPDEALAQFMSLRAIVDGICERLDSVDGAQVG